MITGTTTLIAHVGYPTHAFKAPMVYNPWFEANDIDAVVVPMGVQADDYPAFLESLFRVTNVRGALVTMPHKVVTCDLVDELTPIAQVAGAVNAVRRREDGTLLGDQFDGAGFVRGVERKGLALGRQARARGRQRWGGVADRGFPRRRRREHRRPVRPRHICVGVARGPAPSSTTRSSRCRRVRRTRPATTSW